MVDMQRQVATEVRTFVVNNFLMGRRGDLTDDSSFLDMGLIDSTGMLELVSYLEKTYNIEIADDELIPENLDSINQIAQYLRNKSQMQRDEPAVLSAEAYSDD